MISEKQFNEISSPSSFRDEEPKTELSVSSTDSSTGSRSVKLMEKKRANVDLDLVDFDWLGKDDFDGHGMWVFGYGSLCWHPGFDYNESLIGFIRGFSRKFWQGNSTHRGTEEKPGRVATLIEDDAGIVWGRAFQLKKKETLSYLKNRECELGGYLTTISTFYPRKECYGEKSIKSFPVILYIATSSNRHWVGETPLMEIADRVFESTGNSGHNVEYLIRLADFVRDNIPEAIDDHLFNLEKLVLSKIEEKNLCLETFMGEEKKKFRPKESPDSDEESRGEPEAVAGAGRTSRTDSSFQFTSTVTTKKLRCVNIS